MVLRLVRVDENAKVCKAILPEGTSFIGRGPLLDCADKRVSRKHGELFVMDECIFIKSLHEKNPCFIKKRNSNDLIVVNFEERFPLNNGDRIGFLPDNYWYEVIVSQNMTETQQWRVIDAESVTLNRTNTEPLDFDEPTQSQAIHALSTSNHQSHHSHINKQSTHKRFNDSSTPVSAKVIKREPLTPSKDLPSSSRVSGVPTISDTDRPTNGEAIENDTRPYDANSKDSDNDETFCDIQISTVKTELAEELCSNKDQESPTVINNGHSSPRLNLLSTFSHASSSHIKSSPPQSPPRSPSPQLQLSPHASSSHIKSSPSPPRSSSPHASSQLKSSPPQSPSPQIQLLPARVPSPRPQNNTCVRDRCRYGTSCYRKNPLHLQQFSHPSDADWDANRQTNLPQRRQVGGKRRRQRSSSSSSDGQDATLIVTGKRARRTVARVQWSDSENEDPYKTDDSDDWVPQ